MKKLVIHADDFGLSEAITQGILTAFQQGSVTSACLMVNFPTSRSALQRAKSVQLDLGWRITLTEGYPLTPAKFIPSLVRRDGSFHSLATLIRKSLLGQIVLGEVTKELEAQYQFFLAEKLPPTHVDGHEHVHMFSIIREAVAQVVVAHRIPFVRSSVEPGGPWLPRFAARSFLRLLKATNPARSIPFYGLTLGKKAGELAAWQKLLGRINSDVAEVMVHPGIPPQGGENFDDKFPGNRYAEWTLLTSPQWKSLIKTMGFELISLRNLA